MFEIPKSRNTLYNGYTYLWIPRFGVASFNKTSQSWLPSTSSLVMGQAEFTAAGLNSSKVNVFNHPNAESNSARLNALSRTQNQFYICHSCKRPPPLSPPLSKTRDSQPPLVPLIWPTWRAQKRTQTYKSRHGSAIALILALKWLNRSQQAPFCHNNLAARSDGLPSSGSALLRTPTRPFLTKRSHYAQQAELTYSARLIRHPASSAYLFYP